MIKYDDLRLNLVIQANIKASAYIYDHYSDVSKLG